MSRLAEEMRQAHAAVTEKLAGFAAQMKNVHEHVAHFQKTFELARSIAAPRLNHLNDLVRVSETATRILRDIERRSRISNFLKTSGWLPHDLIPFKLVEEYLNCDPGELTAVLERHFVLHWPETEVILRERYKGVDLDNEALTVMDHALQAFPKQLYSLICPAVFPQIERMARLKYYGPSYEKRFTSLREVRRDLLNLTVGDIGSFSLHQIMVFHKTIDENFYNDFLPNDENCALTIFPNRHIITHGARSFSTVRDSLNAFFVADFLFNVIDAFVRNREAATATTSDPDIV